MAHQNRVNLEDYPPEVVAKMPMPELADLRRRCRSVVDAIDVQLSTQRLQVVGPYTSREKAWRVSARYAKAKHTELMRAISAELAKRSAVYNLRGSRLILKELIHRLHKYKWDGDEAVKALMEEGQRYLVDNPVSITERPVQQ